MDSADRQGWFGRRRPWVWLAAAALFWLLGCLGLWLFVRARGVARLEAERGLLRAGGTSLELPRVAPTPAETGANVRDWIDGLQRALADAHASIGTLPPLFQGVPFHRALTTLIGAFVSTTAFGDAPFTVPAAFDADRECAALAGGSPVDPGDLLLWLQQTLEQPVRLRQSAACVRLALEGGRGRSKLLERALEARGLARAESAEWLCRMESANKPVPSPGLEVVPVAIRELGQHALERALAGDVDGARQALTAAERACESIRDLNWLLAYSAWEESERLYLESLGPCLSLLEPDQLPESLDSHLDSLDARRRFLSSVDGQIALIERAFERFEAGETVGELQVDRAQGDPLLVFERAMLPHEHADLLCRWREFRAECEAQSGASFRVSADYRASPWSSSRLAPWFLPPHSYDRHPWAHVESRAALLRIARVARRDGVEAAEGACATTTDPFSGAPLLSRRETDGTLTLWSVGVDGVDGGAVPRTSLATSFDIVLRVIPR